MANEFVVRNGLIVSGSTYLEAISQSNEAYILSYDSVTNEVAYMPTSSVVVTVPGSDTQIIYNNGGVFGASSNLVFSGSRVGIGTTAPTYKLSVQSTDTAGATGTGATLQLLSDTTAVANKGGSVIFGDAGNAIRAMIKGMYIGPAGSGGGLAFSTAEDSGGAITERMRLIAQAT